MSVRTGTWVVYTVPHPNCEGCIFAGRVIASDLDNGLFKIQDVDDGTTLVVTRAEVKAYLTLDGEGWIVTLLFERNVSEDRFTDTSDLYAALRRGVQWALDDLGAAR